MRLRVTVEGKTYNVDVEVLDGESGSSPSTPRPAAAAPAPGATEAPAPAAAAPPPVAAGENVLQSPIAGTILSVAVSPGDAVELNQVLMVMEAMKMETNIAAPTAGTIKAVHVSAGDTVKQGQLLVEFG